MYKNENLRKISLKKQLKGHNSETKNDSMTRRLDMIYIPIKFHEYIHNGYWVMVRARLFKKIFKEA